MREEAARSQSPQGRGGKSAAGERLPGFARRSLARWRAGCPPGLGGWREQLRSALQAVTAAKSSGALAVFGFPLDQGHGWHVILCCTHSRACNENKYHAQTRRRPSAPSEDSSRRRGDFCERAAGGSPRGSGARTQELQPREETRAWPSPRWARLGVDTSCVEGRTP